MRLLFVISAYPPAKKAGMEGNCQRIAQALVRRGHQVTVLTRTASGMPRESSEEGVRVLRIVHPLAIGPLWGLTYLAGIRRHAVAIREAWEVAVCFGLGLNSVAVESACRRLRRPWINRIASAGDRGDIAAMKRLNFGTALLRRAIASTGHFALSAEVEADLLREGVPAQRIRRYPPSVDLERFRPGDSSRDEPTFLYVGRFSPKKNVPLLVDAFASVWRQHPSARLRLIGAGDSEAQVRQAASRSPARDAITVLPWSDSPEAEYRRAFATVTASASEGLSNSLLEAMASGLACIATDVGGVRDVLLDSDQPGRSLESGILVTQRGVIVEPGNGAALARAMTHLLEEPARARELGARARLHAEEHFSVDAAVDSFIGSIEDLSAGVDL